MLVSELGGSRGLLDKVEELGIEYPFTRDDARALAKQSRSRRRAATSTRARMRRSSCWCGAALPGYKPPFDLDDFWMVERRATARARRHDREMQAEAMAKVRVFRQGGRGRVPDGRRRQRPRQRPRRRRAQGARRVLPGDLRRDQLVDYKVRIIDSGAGTGASVRVLIESAATASAPGRPSAPARTSSRRHGWRSPTRSSGGF